MCAKLKATKPKGAGKSGSVSGAGDAATITSSTLARRAGIAAVLFLVLGATVVLYLGGYSLLVGRSRIFISVRNEPAPLGTPVVQVVKSGSSDEEIVRDAVADEAAAREALRIVEEAEVELAAAEANRKLEEERQGARLTPEGSTLAVGGTLVRKGVLLSLSQSGELSLKNANNGELLWAPAKMRRPGGNFFVRRVLKPVVRFIERAFRGKREGELGRSSLDDDLCNSCVLMLSDSGRLVIKEGRRILWSSPKPPQGMHSFEAVVEDSKEGGLVVYGLGQDSKDGPEIIWQAL